MWYEILYRVLSIINYAVLIVIASRLEFSYNGNLLSLYKVFSTVIRKTSPCYYGEEIRDISVHSAIYTDSKCSYRNAAGSRLNFRSVNQPAY